jgi:hypothetical protein
MAKTAGIVMAASQGLRIMDGIFLRPGFPSRR